MGGEARIRALVAFPSLKLLVAIAAFAVGAATLMAVPQTARAQDAPAPPQQPAGATDSPPPPEASSGDIDGETMFATSCGFCHSDGGRSEGKGPKLSNSKRSDEYIIDRVKKGKLGAMPAFGRAFSEGQIMAIVAYIRGLDE